VPVPAPKYVKTDDGAYLAYQVVGDGPVDIAWLFDYSGNLDLAWEGVTNRTWFEALASFGRLVLHDRRGTGLSSRNVPIPNLETRAADLRAVLDAVGSEQPVVGALFEGLAPAVLLAATDPGLLRALVWWLPDPCMSWAPDYPWGLTAEQFAQEQQDQLANWGSDAYGQAWAKDIEDATGLRPTPEEARVMSMQTRNTCTPDIAAALHKVWWETDVRPLLPAVKTPTLLLVHDGAGQMQEIATYVHSLMPSSELRVMPEQTWPQTPLDAERIYRPYRDAVQRFIGMAPERVALDTVLATVLFTDIVGSTERQARLGDRDWKLLVERHNQLVRDTLADWRGVEQDTAGDGFYATFDGPARAIRCGLAIRDGVRRLGIEIRAGIHTGECELVDGKVGGIAVTIGARIAALSGASKVLVSQTVKDLVAGSGFAFAPLGGHELKGVPDRWRIFEVTDAG
jgi:class 3 adenylate cyclase/pimeloyl-ACP methyl ester carboxylesterase